MEFSPLRATSFWRSFGYASAGVFYVVRTQRNARIHLAVAAAVVALGIYLDLPRLDWVLLVITIGMVLIAEFVNTVVEALVDLISPELHPLAKVAKDVASGAVLVLALMAIIVGLLILGPPLYERMLTRSHGPDAALPLLDGIAWATANQLISRFHH